MDQLTCLTIYCQTGRPFDLPWHMSILTVYKINNAIQQKVWNTRKERSQLTNKFDNIVSNSKMVDCMYC